MSEITIPTKICTVCKIEKSVIDFGINLSSGNNSSWCIDCTKIYNQERYKNKRRNFIPRSEYDGVSVKICNMCGQNKPLIDYYYNASYGKLYDTCKPCHLDATKEARKKSKLKSKYGITKEELDVMMYNQGWKCMICDAIFDIDSTGHGAKPNVDHDARNGKVRGVLCTSCNVLLGIYKEDTERLKACSYEKHAKYLERFK